MQAETMAQPFDNALATLTLEQIQTFLEHELEEGLTWEAKGSHEIRPEQVRKAVSGFANAVGGSLILGAERDASGWRLPGVMFPGGEAKTWLSSVIRELEPVPRYEVRVFPADGEALVAVVGVEPVDVPPCMSGGSVFERVSGQTVPVTDPASLRSLFARGAEARDSAVKRAQRSAVAIFHDPEIPHEAYRLVAHQDARLPGRPAFGFAIAPVAWPDACREAVFRASFRERLEDATVSRMAGPVRRAEPRYEQTRSLVQVLLPDWYGFWTVRVYVDGAAAAAYTTERTSEQIAPINVMNRLEETWKLASDALEAIGAAGAAYFALYLRSTRQPPGGQWIITPPMMDVLGGLSIGPPTVAALDSIKRELDREAGYLASDPEPEPET